MEAYGLCVWPVSMQLTCNAQTIRFQRTVPSQVESTVFDLGVRTYVYSSVTLGKDRHIHTVTLGKDRHIHIRIYARAHGQCQWTENEMETEETALERRRKLARERECYRIFQVG